MGIWWAAIRIIFPPDANRIPMRRLRGTTFNGKVQRLPERDRPLVRREAAVTKNIQEWLQGKEYVLNEAQWTYLDSEWQDYMTSQGIDDDRLFIRKLNILDY